MKNSMKVLITGFLLLGFLVHGCTVPVDNVVGPSTSGQTIGISALFGGGGLKNNGTSQATIRVEVFTSGAQPVTGAVVTLTTTLGTLGAASLTTANGSATTTLTSSTTTGLASIVATVENVSATTVVPIVSF